jgi:hypothetical protein
MLDHLMVLLALHQVEPHYTRSNKTIQCLELGSRAGPASVV